MLNEPDFKKYTRRPKENKKIRSLHWQLLSPTPIEVTNVKSNSDLQLQTPAIEIINFKSNYVLLSDVPSETKNKVPSNNSDLDFPIADCKGTRTCTQPPISKLISYNYLSFSCHNIVSCLSKMIIAQNWREAIADKKWREAMVRKMDALDENNHGRLCLFLVEKQL